MQVCSEKLKGVKNETISNKPSDFSIDHILNRAGQNNCDDVNLCDRISLETMAYHQQHFVEDNSLVPMFDWLQYTRYRPPKLPRPFRPKPVKRTPGRLPRVPFTPAQLNALENAYKISTYLSSEEANKLALKLDLTNTRVKIWFQNRRARERREKRDKEENLSARSSPDSEYEITH